MQMSRIVVGRELNGIGRVLRGRDYIINALIASPAGHPLWLEIMQRMSACRRARRLLERHTVHAIRMSIAVFDETIEARQKLHGDIDVLGHTAFYPSSPAEHSLPSLLVPRGPVGVDPGDKFAIAL